MVLYSIYERRLDGKFYLFTQVTSAVEAMQFQASLLCQGGAVRITKERI